MSETFRGTPEKVKQRNTSRSKKGSQSKGDVELISFTKIKPGEFQKNMYEKIGTAQKPERFSYVCMYLTDQIPIS